MALKKLMSNLTFFVILASAPLAAQEPQDRHRGQAYGKLSASTQTAHLVIADPQSTVPSADGWQPLPVDTFSTHSHTKSHDPSNATIEVKRSGAYLLNALLTLAYPNPGSDGPDDLTNYAIGVMINGELQLDSIGSLHISTEGGQENPGLLFSATLSDLVELSKDDVVQFVVSGGTGAASPAYMVVVSANATVEKIGN